MAHTTSFPSTYLVRGSPGASILRINHYKAFGKADHPGLNLAGYGRSGRDHDFYNGDSPNKLKRCTMLKSPIWECCCTSGCISLSCIMSWHWRITRSDDGKQDRIHRGSCARGTGLESTGLRDETAALTAAKSVHRETTKVLELLHRLFDPPPTRDEGHIRTWKSISISPYFAHVSLFQADRSWQIG